MKREIMYMLISILAAVVMKVVVNHPPIYMLVLPGGMAAYLLANETIRRWRA